MQQRNETEAKTMTLMRSALYDAFNPDRVAKILHYSQNQSQEQVGAALREVAWSAVEDKFVTVDPTPIVGPEAQIRKLPYYPDQPVGRFLDDVWFSLVGKVPAYRYADLWIIRDRNSKFELRDAGRRWALERGEEEDSRPIRDVGIRPGMHLEAIRIKPA